MTSNGHAADTFQELLRSLQQEHERQLQALESQVAALQQQLERLSGLSAGNGNGNGNGNGHGPILPSDGAEEVSAAKALGIRHLDSTASKATTVPGCWNSALEPSKISVTFDGAIDGGVEVLELKGVWKDLIRQHSRHNNDIHRLTERSDFEKEQLEEQAEKEDRYSVAVACATKLFKHGVISPNSSWRLYWECAGLVLVCFDMINIPLSTVYEPPDTTFSIMMDWTTLLFWTADMAQAFFVGYYEKGNLIMWQPKVVKHYFKTWFTMDAIVVWPDWFLTILGTGTQAGDLSRLLRTSRAIRVLRLLRVMKLQRVLNKLYDLIDNEYSFIIAELIKMMMVILVVNHVIACGWFGMGKVSVYILGQPSWVTWSENFLDSDIGYQYMTSLHWTLTQFTPASMDVVARNILERIYSIIVLLFAMVAFSSIVGTVTSSMTVIRSMKNDRQKQFWMLRRYLKQKNVSVDLTMRMTRFLEHQQAKQQKLIQASKVTFLQQLSDQLARELAFEMFHPSLTNHPFIRFLGRDMKGVAARICQMALKAMQVATGDTIFSLGEDAHRAFILKSGELSYNTGVALHPPPQEKEWLAEAAIWTPWRYRGKLLALKPCDLLAVEASRFAEAMSLHPKPVSLARVYGQKFVTLMNGFPQSQWTDVVRDEEFYNGAIFEVGKRANAPDDDDSSSLSDVEVEKSGLNGHTAEDNGFSNGETGRAEEKQSPEQPRSPVAASPWSRLGGGRFFATCFHPCSSEQVHAGPPGLSSTRGTFW